jgi:hypothetical protein
MGIVNTDSSARTKYLSTKSKILSDRQELEQLKLRVDEMEKILRKLSSHHQVYGEFIGGR